MMNNDNNYIGAIVVLIVLVLVVLAVIGVQKYRDIKFSIKDKQKEVVVANNAAKETFTYKLIDLEEFDYIVSLKGDKYEYQYSDNNIVYIDTIDDNMYFSDSKGIFYINTNDKYERKDISKIVIDKGYIYDNKLYYLNDNNVNVMELSNGNIKKIINNVSNMYLFNGIIYYLDGNRLSSYDVVSEKSKTILDHIVDFSGTNSMLLTYSSNNDLALYDISNNKNNVIVNVNYDVLETNAYFYNGSVYYMEGNNINRYTNGKVDLYYTSENVVGFEILTGSVFKLYYLDGSVHYLSNNNVSDDIPLDTFEITFVDGNTIKFNNSNVKK